MRKLTLVLMCLLVFMVGCGNDDALEQSTSPKENIESKTRLYGMKQSGEASTTRGVAQNTNVWGRNLVITDDVDLESIMELV